MNEHVGICRGMSTASREGAAIGADGCRHVISREVHAGSRWPGVMSLPFNAMWLTVGHVVSKDAVETGLVLIGLDDTRVLRKRLSCPLV